MVTRILGTAVGVLLLLYVLLLRGLPVLFFIKMLPLIFLIMVAAALIYAGVTSD
jgi:predicted tellurium resistance membrane protein TerC